VIVALNNIKVVGICLYLSVEGVIPYSSFFKKKIDSLAKNKCYFKKFKNCFSLLKIIFKIASHCKYTQTKIDYI
jgi:hypothetical protein